MKLNAGAIFDLLIALRMIERQVRRDLPWWQLRERGRKPPGQWFKIADGGSVLEAFRL